MKKTRFLIFVLVFAMIVSSLAFAVAAGNGLVRPGDANGDGKTDAKDLILLRQHLASKDYATGQGSVGVESDADINRDGKINLLDICVLRSYLTDGYVLDIVESDGLAAVKTVTGANYTVSGYDAIENDEFFA